MFKPWEYEGYYFDDSIGIYICEKSGKGATMSWMACHKKHLRKEKRK